MWTSVESRAPAVSRIAPTTPEATSVTARQDTGSAQTAVTATVRQVLRQHSDWRLLSWRDSEGLVTEHACGCFWFDGVSVAVLSVLLRLCSDVDECLAVNGGCEHTCQNGAGSFQCFCRRGFRLDEDRQSCIRECWRSC